jgi:DNA-binding phage protein
MLTSELLNDYVQTRLAHQRNGETFSWVTCTRSTPPLLKPISVLANANPSALGTALRELAEEQDNVLNTQSSKQALLDNFTTIRNAADAMAKLDEWIERLRKVCERRGAMSDLARTLKVSRQAVAQWLSTDPNVRTRPAGELVLPLVEWVGSEEAQQSSSASATAPAERKAHVKRKSHAKS